MSYHALWVFVAILACVCFAVAAEPIAPEALRTKVFPGTPPADSRIATPRTLHQGAGMVPPATKEQWAARAVPPRAGTRRLRPLAAAGEM